jgi:putative serine protease PepD
MSDPHWHPNSPEWRDDTRPLAGPPGPPGPQAPASAPVQAPTRRRGAAGLLAAALVVGGLGGVAGAAGFSALDDDAAAPVRTTAPDAGTSPPSDAGDPGNTNAVTEPEQESEPDAAATLGSAEEVARAVLPSVVQITVRGLQGQGSGSGIVLSSDGEILTNNHVVDVAAGGGGQLSVSFNDGSAARAEIVGTDPMTDLAVIKARGVTGLTPAKLGRTADLGVGEEVVAVGSPFGLEATVTSGIVSALDRPVTVPGGSETRTVYPAIQTDAAINPGNSGGPLVNMRGEVIGVNSSIRSVTSSSTGEAGSIGLGFAIPLDTVFPIVEQLRAGKDATHARMGVGLDDTTTDDGLLSAAVITTVEPGSAAAEAGLRRGDVVTRVDDQAITGSDDLIATIRSHRPGDRVTVTVVRDGDKEQAEVTLGSDEGTAAP